MVTVEKKHQIVASLTEKLKKATGIYLIGFETMTVAETIALRRTLRAKGLEMQVAKNTLIERAFADAGGTQIPLANYFGQSALILSYDDALAPSKIIKEAFEKNEKPRFKAAVVEGQFFDAKDLKVLASLPSKNELIASILGSLNAPISGIVGAVNAVLRDVAYLVEEVAKKQAA